VRSPDWCQTLADRLYQARAVAKTVGASIEAHGQQRVKKKSRKKHFFYNSQNEKSILKKIEIDF
jgi:hypothetical protein